MTGAPPGQLALLDAEPDPERPPEVFAKVRHQVRVKLVNDDAVAEAVKLTKLAVEKALNDEW